MIADLVFTAGALFFIVGLVPMVRAPREDAPPLSTSATTGGWLAIFAVTYVFLGLPFSAITTGITAALWLTLAWRRRRRYKWWREWLFRPRTAVTCESSPHPHCRCNIVKELS